MTREEAIKFLKVWNPIHPAKQEARDMAVEALKQPEIVRCKDCKHRDPEDRKCDSGHGIKWQLPRSDDFFCADGEKG